MKNTWSISVKLSLNKYKLIIFDWDGTLVDSLESYEKWDRLYVQRFYGVDLSPQYFKDLIRDLKSVKPGSSEDEYFLYLDNKHGNGSTPIEKIWENIYSLAPDIQSQITYKDGAPELLKLLRSNTRAYLALATNAEKRDIEFFSSSSSQTASDLSPIEFFDSIVTSDDIKNRKPDPETFQKVIERYKVMPSEVLIFEDSVNGIMAAKSSGADVVAVFGNDEANELADITIANWGELQSMLQEDVS